jgi:GT2 family glycosyltransferase
LLDDDSILDGNYIENLKNAIYHRANVAIPLIFHDKKLISPGAISGVKGRVINRTELNLGFNNNKNIVAMMSGTLIRTAVFKKIKFDERLSFYGVDTKFFIDYQQKFNSIYIMDCSMEHDSALRTKTGTPIQNYNRLMMLVSSWRYVYDHVFLYRTRLSLRIVLFSLKHIVLMKNLIPGKLLKFIIPIWKE